MKISFVTASRDETKPALLRKNLETVFAGCTEIDWDLTPAIGYPSIARAYNWGAENSKGEILCFIHDDVELICAWTCFREPLRLLSKVGAGLLGVAGTKTLPKDGKWWSAKNEECRGAVYHAGPEEFGARLNGWPAACALFGPVATVDGVLILVNRKTFNGIGKFDADSYAGWHLYDTDLSVRAHKAGRTNFVCPIPLVHESPGRPGAEYEVNLKIFLDKFGKELPISVKE
jgi:hypothetical protein